MSAADDLRALSTAATPGPWVVMRTGIISDAEAFSDVDDGDECHFGSCTVIDDAVDHPEDATLIVWCRNHAAALADLIDAAEALAQPAGWWTGVEHRQEHQLLDRRAVVRDALNALDALEADRG